MPDTIRLSLTDEWHEVASILIATEAETRAMVCDLVALLTPHGCAQVLCVKLPALRRWIDGSLKPSRVNRRLIWIVWANVCRPGQVVTVFDLATWGRFTALGGPEHAGTPALRRKPK